MKKQGFPWLRIVVHLLGALPLAEVIILGLTGGLSINPIQDIEQRLGRAAIYFLVASLAVTPLMTITGIRTLAQRRRALGLYAFMYISLRFLTFFVLDYGLDVPLVVTQILQKPYLIVGVSTGLVLIPVAITSFDYFVRKMGKKWKTLHKIVYFTGLSAVLHYGLAEKGNLFSLSGNIGKPLFWGGVVILLLVLRIPAVRKWVSATRQKIKTARQRRSMPITLSQGQVKGQG